MVKIVSFFFFILMIVGESHSFAIQEETSNLTGFYGYQDPIEEPPQEEEKPLEKIMIEPLEEKVLIDPPPPQKEELVEDEPIQTKYTGFSLKDYSEQELWKMKASEFRVLLINVREDAVTTLDYEDVYEYFFLQNIAGKKAAAFTNIAGLVQQQHPELNARKEYPIVEAGRKQRAANMEKEIYQTIYQGQKEFGMIYLQEKTCIYCRVQNGILGLLVNKYPRIDIQSVDRALYPEVAESFGIKYVPALILIYEKSSNFFPVAHGVTSLKELEQNIFRGMRFLKETVRPEQFYMYEAERGGAFDPLAPLKD